MAAKRDWAEGQVQPKHPSAWLPALAPNLEQLQGSLLRGRDLAATLQAAGLSAADAQAIARQATALEQAGGDRRRAAGEPGIADELPRVSVTWVWSGLRISLPAATISWVNNAIGAGGATSGVASTLLKAVIDIGKLAPPVAGAAATPPGAVAAGVAVVVLTVLAANLGAVWGLVKAVDDGHGVNINVSYLALPVVIASAGTLSFTLFIPTKPAFWNFQHQQRGANWEDPDFKNSHESGFVDLVDHDGAIQRVRAIGNAWVYVVRETQAEIRQTGVLRYQSWDGSKWYARIYGARFIHSTRADFSSDTHESDILNYLNTPTVGYSLRLV